jgi:predicted dehydrogenase
MSAGGGPPALRVGIVGYGLMGKAHSYGYRVAPLLRRLPVTPVVTVMSGRDAGALAAAASAYGVPATVTGSTTRSASTTGGCPRSR